MILRHRGKTPRVHPGAYVAPNATICGDVTLAAGVRIMFGACVIAEGQPIVPPDQHDAIWKLQRPLDFPGFVYGVKRALEGESNMAEITRRRSTALGRHEGDEIVDGDADGNRTAP